MLVKAIWRASRGSSESPYSADVRASKLSKKYWRFFGARSCTPIPAKHHGPAPHKKVRVNPGKILWPTSGKSWGQSWQNKVAHPRR